MKIFFLISSFIFVMGCSTCTRDFPIDDEKFEDYIPWWASNQNQVVGVSNIVYKINIEEDIHYALNR